MNDLREKVARVIWGEIYPSGTSWDDWAEQVAKNGGFDGRDASRQIADRILALPELAALKLTIVKPLNLGASISTDKRDPV